MTMSNGVPGLGLSTHTDYLDNLQEVADGLTGPHAVCLALRNRSDVTLVLRDSWCSGGDFKGDLPVDIPPQQVCVRVCGCGCLRVRARVRVCVCVFVY